MVSEQDFYVYVIYRLDGRPAYVGKGKGKRWQKHAWRSTNPHLAAIYKQSGGELPRVKVAEGLTEEQAFATEVQLIAELGRELHGGPLVNLTDGGEGVAGRPMDPELVERLRKIHTGNSYNRGRKFTDEHKEKLRQAKLGKKQSAEVVEKRIASRRGVERPPEVREKIKAGLTGKKHTEERRAAFRAAWVRRKARTQTNEV